MVAYNACHVVQEANSSAMKPNTSNSMWTSALKLANQLIRGTSIDSDVGARYCWKGASNYASTKVNVKYYLTNGSGNYFIMTIIPLLLRLIMIIVRIKICLYENNPVPAQQPRLQLRNH